MKFPVRITTPASTAAGPTVGANCRGFGTADAMGRLKYGPMDASGIWGGKMQLSLHSSCQSDGLYFSLDGLQVLLELFTGGQCEFPQPNGAPLSLLLPQGPNLPL